FERSLPIELRLREPAIEKRMLRFASVGRRPAPWRHGAGGKRLRLVGNDELRHKAFPRGEPLARRAGAIGTVEAEGPRFDFGEVRLAVGAGVPRAEDVLLPAVFRGGGIGRGRGPFAAGGAARLGSLVRQKAPDPVGVAIRCV